MLSIENPPPDPSCPCEISQLKSGGDERASDKVALQEVDLLKSGLDDQNPLPKFSIRDYVVSSRSKDIQTNWPFSQKSLQLCLKHGVKDLLPPFQPLDSVRNRFVGRCTIEAGLLDRENISNSNGEPSRPSDHFETDNSNIAGCIEKLAVDCVNINSSGFEGDKEFPSTTTSQSRSDIDSVPTDRTPCSALDTDTLLEAAAANPEAVDPPASLKNESTTQPSIKRCKLIVKLGSLADPSSNEEITSNCMTFSETMASKVCPVCKTFSSSSNTTLNAHIDQCLSAESTVGWTANSKVVKHRIKPRKTKLMVDIYETAPRCTLEELDRRNGTCWAMNSCLPTQETVVCAEERKERVSPVNFEDTGDDGAVYIDANGTKVRILSKFSEPSSSKVGADLRPRKLLKGGKRSKFLSTNKKNCHAQKHKKYLKLAPQSKFFCSPSPGRGSEVYRCQERTHAVEEFHKKEEHLIQSFKVQKQIKMSEGGTIRKWVRSKRTGLSKKSSLKEGVKRSKYNLTQDLLVESDQSCLGDSYAEGSFLKNLKSSENPLSSHESSKRMECSSNGAQVTECDEQPSLRKRVGIFSSGSQISGNVESSSEIPKRNAKQLRKDMPDSCKDLPNYREKRVSSPSNQAVKISTGPVKSFNSYHDASAKLSQRHNALLSKTTRKNVLSLRQSTAPESNCNLSRKRSELKKSRVPWMEELDEDLVTWPSEVDEHHDSMQNHAENQSRVEEMTDKVSIGRRHVLKIRKKRGALSISKSEETMAALKSSRSTPHCYAHDAGKHVDFSVRVRGGLTDTFDDIEYAEKGDRTCWEEGSVVNKSRSSDPEFHKQTNPSYTRSDLMHCLEVFKGSLCGAEAPMCPTEQSLGDEQEMFCADAVGNGVMEQNIHMGTEFDCKVGQGNYFLDVDPIPIPGPPGSFLPSPGHLGSEDLQGNSTLTTSRVHSSEDRHDMVDRDLSDSPISATSAISNSSVVRSDLEVSENFSGGPHVTQEENRSGFAGASHDPVVENNATVQPAASAGAERMTLDELKINAIFPDKGPLGFKNDQPCCCSRKEGTSEGVALNYQESQLLRRRNMASVPLPAMGKQMSYDPNIRPSFNSRAEMFTVTNFPSLESEKLILSDTRSPEGPIHVNVSADSTLKFPIRGGCDSASPSASNPVLRLMGKNLMVVNKDEDLCPQLRQSQSGELNDHPNPQIQTLSGVSSGNVQNGDFRCFDHMVHQSPLIFGQNQNNKMGQGFDVRLSNCFRSHVNAKATQALPQASVPMFTSKNMGSCFTASLKPHEYKGGYSLPTEQSRPKNGPDTLTNSTEKVLTTPDPLHRNANSTTNPVKEIIIIDDTPESEPGSSSDATNTEGMKGNQH
ncbi:uncharacterized protein LOC132312308 isoform X2 [Cornus florida]|uniref:uncharacterized protein LOC132312308 isoform X2 n=1 Tax=Cornus florida TaxID=4283 RepID=UPI0028A27328|nr:uncharacterized protein LOC132312308 isoform X2 [Cornus florida]